jgi:SAM-dependent methyltransferase
MNKIYLLLLRTFSIFSKKMPKQWSDTMNLDVKSEDKGIYFKNSGHCPACDTDVNFIATNKHFGISYVCTNCDSRPRERALINAINTYYPRWKNLLLHESSPLLRRGASKLMSRECKQYIASQYFPNKAYGSLHKGIRCENLEELTFEDESIDLHVTQDVMEHVISPYKAFKEIARTLKPGGAHIFTIPIVQRHNPSKRRARLNDDGKIEYLEEPQYHGNPVGDGLGALVTIDWGYDICEHIYDSCGLFTHIYRVDDISMGIRSPRTEVFISIKPVNNYTLL